MTQIADRLTACYSGVVYDVLRDMGLPARVLPRTIRGITTAMRCAGPVFAVRGRPDPTLSPHESLLAWTGLLSDVPPGSVVVCQPQDDTRALMGELSAEALALRGCRGYIVDGGCRDTGLIETQGFPVFRRFDTPIDIVAAWRPEATAVPVVLGNVQVLPDDFVLADRDGIILIPGSQAEAVVTAAETAMATESDLRRALRNGEDPREAYLKYGKF
jgi:regulator of RNase E activity RraA